MICHILRLRRFGGAVDRTGAAGPGLTGHPRCLLLPLASSSARPLSRAPDDEDWDMVIDWAVFCGRAAAAATASGWRGNHICEMGNPFAETKFDRFCSFSVGGVKKRSSCRKQNDHGMLIG